jgi:hypothetical protein
MVTLPVMSSTSSPRRASAIARGALVALGIAFACGVASSPGPGAGNDEGGVLTTGHPAAPCEADLRVPALAGVSVDDGDGDDHDDGFALPAEVTALRLPARTRGGPRATEASPDRRRPRREPALSTGPPSATNAIDS